MDTLLDDVHSTVRRTLLGKAQAALKAGNGTAAAEHYRTLAALLRKEADETRQPPQRERKLAAAERFDAEAEAALGKAGGQTAPVPGEAPQGSANAGRTWEPVELPPVTMDDVVGLDSVKDELRRTLMTPLAHPDLARLYRVPPGGNVMLYGPPGGGKTLLVKATAAALGAPLFIAKGSDLLSKWQGESEANLASLFTMARGHELSVIFVDEFQWLAPSGEGEMATETGRRLVCQLLQELQGFEQHTGSHMVFLAATNYPWKLDQAAIRLGRFQRHLLVPPPDFRARQKLFARSLKDRPQAGVDCRLLAQQTEGYTAADVVTMVDCAAREALDQSAALGREVPITQAMLVEQVSKTAPSASPELIRRCEEWARAHS